VWSLANSPLQHSPLLLTPCTERLDRDSFSGDEEGTAKTLHRTLISGLGNVAWRIWEVFEVETMVGVDFNAWVRLLTDTEESISLGINNLKIGIPQVDKSLNGLSSSRHQLVMPVHNFSFVNNES
jgi:hypothetical protein